MRYVGVDIGATKTIGLELNPKTGETLKELFRFDNTTLLNNSDLTSKIEGVVSKLGSPEEVKIGIAFAGVIKGLEAICANLQNIREPVTLARDLKERGFEVFLLNDMQAATLGEACYGNGRNFCDIAVATYSSGYNYSVAHRGKLIERVIEAGHQPYKSKSGLFCSCGGEGHLETFVSGNGAAAMAKQALMMQGIPFHTIFEEYIRDRYKDNFDEKIKLVKNNLEIRREILIKEIGSKHVYMAYRKKPNENPQATIRDIQIEAIAYSFGQMVSNSSPLDIISCIGSQTNDWDILFEPAIELYSKIPGNFQHPELKIPEIVRCKDGDIVAKGSVAHLLRITE